jgi:hypothetical protein
MGNYRSGRNLPDTDIAVQLAEILGVDELKVIADIELERGTNDELWRRIAKRVAMVLFAAGAASSGGFNNNAIASPSSAPSPIEETSAGRNTHCAMIRYLRNAHGWRARAVTRLAFGNRGERIVSRCEAVANSLALPPEPCPWEQHYLAKGGRASGCLVIASSAPRDTPTRGGT